MTNNKQQTEMKLYTEHDIENAFNSGRGYGIPDDIKDFNSFIQSITPISLPSDEEINEMGKDVIIYNDTKRGWFVEGLKWMRDKIEGGNK
jgi:hypothetical protein